MIVHWRWMARHVCVLAVLSAGLLNDVPAQTAPFPDMTASLAHCRSRNNGTENCVLSPIYYLDKALDDTDCMGWPCNGGPGRWQYITGSPGQPTEYRWSHEFLNDDVVITLNGKSSTRALPAGPALPQTIKAKMGRYNYPRASVGLQVNGGGIRWGVTNAAGEWTTNYIPPIRKSSTVQVKALCWSGCVNTVEKVITVSSVDMCDRVGNPVSPAAGEKIQEERDWVDGGPHPLSFIRYFRSLGTVDAGLGTNWSTSTPHPLRATS